MNTNFYLTVLFTIVANKPRYQYYMAIFSVTSPKEPIFTSYLYSDEDDMIEVGKAYAKRLGIPYRESVGMRGKRKS